MYQFPLYLQDHGTAIIASFIGIASFAYFLTKNSRKNYPPGPMGLPILGYTPFLGKNPGEAVMKLKKQYGSIISLKMGTQTWIILNDYDVVYEALVKKAEVFSGRVQNHFFDKVSEMGKGIILRDYSVNLRTIRKFGQQTLRGFGVGQKGMEVNIVEEASYLIENLTSNNKDSLRGKLTHAVGNVVNRLTFGTRLPYEDETFRTLLRTTDDFFTNNPQAKLIGLSMFLPILRHLPFFRGALRSAEKELQVMFGLVDKMIVDHDETLDGNNIRDVIDAFLQKTREEGTSEKIFSLINLRHLVTDLYQAGVGTITATLQWILLGLVNYPQYQDRIAKEVDNALGEEGTASMNHREKMPFTCSYIHEVMRHRTELPFSMFHKTTEQTTLGGYTIPKHSTVIPNLWAVLHDPEIFENPDVFKPDRFIDENGKFISSPHVIPFSLGQRRCIGDQLAWMELFIFTTTIVQKLRIVKDSSGPTPVFEEGDYSLITYDPKEYEIIFEPR